MTRLLHQIPVACTKSYAAAASSSSKHDLFPGPHSAAAADADAALQALRQAGKQAGWKKNHGRRLKRLKDGLLLPGLVPVKDSSSSSLSATAQRRGERSYDWRAGLGLPDQPEVRSSGPSSRRLLQLLLAVAAAAAVRDILDACKRPLCHAALYRLTGRAP
ncbi:hypothetical protein AXG93_2912s1000 [Marchantia polymorpha subsp. ruderalis]|uniref:Uncharacterized protein n=1 Tax=Marchantia polymorpha subsp. ruderalis TaxID=1480154 RepID=A0A176WHQ3_MARPO|nr:hypothetical protein AXG93_2912s1000 [Marchantia polymorpha subsp. ruderalis]